MKEYINDIQNLIVKHWGKLIITTIIVTLLINYKDVSNGFMDGFRDSYYGKNKTQTKIIYNFYTIGLMFNTRWVINILGSLIAFEKLISKTVAFIKINFFWHV